MQRAFQPAKWAIGQIIVLGYEAQSFCGLSIRTPNGNRHSTGGQVDDDEDENAIIDDAD